MNEYYSEKANLIQYKVNHYKRITSYCTVLKISSFAGMLISLFVLWNNISWLVPIFILLLILFIIACALQGKFYRKGLFFNTYKKVLDIEIDADNGKYDELSSGDEYINTDHLFTSDLDIFGNNSVFTQVNRTCTVHGKEILANNFISPFIDKKEIKNRQEAIRELSRKNDFRETFRVMGLLLQKKDASLKSLNQWIYNDIDVCKKWWFYLIIGGVIATNISLFFLAALGILPITYFIFSLTTFAILSNIIEHKMDKVHDLITRGVNTLYAYSELLKIISEEKFESALLKDLQSKVSKDRHSASSSLNKLMQIVNMLDQRENLLLHLVFEGLMCWQLIQLARIEKWKRKNKEQLSIWINISGEFDALCSLGTFAFNHPQYSYPILSDIPGTCIAKDMGHPLISQAKCVYNNVEILKTPYFLIVTGANMAGKSTYLRAVGVNYILACMGAPVCASYFEFYPTRLITSLHTSDSLLKNESYFFSELKKIKLIIDNLKDEKPIFILLDEILKGTNSFDKQRGSVALIEQLIRLKSNGIIATHDLQLGDLENKYPQYVKNYHFSAKVTDDTLSFDYKIKPGIVTELNAYFLMQKMGIIKS